MSTPTKGPKKGPIYSDSTYLSKSQRYGLKAEEWVFDQLTQRGYSPTVPPDFLKSACDMKVDGLCIEVKAAQRTRRYRTLADGTKKAYWRWQWQIHETHKGEFCLILIADTAKKRVCFLLPGSQVGDRTHLQITSHPDQYSGWMAEYREKWEMIDFLLAEAYKDNGPLFAEWNLERVAGGAKVAA